MRKHIVLKKNMSSASNWRSTLTATDRYEYIARLKKCIELKGLTSTGNTHKAAFAVENEAYNTSETREAYDAACNAIIKEAPSTTSPTDEEPKSPGIPIGSHPSCHHVASGLVSEVYRTKTLALKVITETRDVEPHNAALEVKLLSSVSHPSIITLNTTFRDQHGRFVLEFPYMPLTLAKVLSSHITAVPRDLVRTTFHDLFSALSYLHAQNIIHRDIKPSNLLLASVTGPAYLADFGTAWHPTLSLPSEPAHHKVLEVGTTCYRAPETLFGNRSYSTFIDMWASGTMLVECLRSPPRTLFESRETSEDGNQLGLILSMFKTLGTPTRERWPEAEKFSTPPFEWYQEFPGKGWDDLLEGVDEQAKDLVGRMICYESSERLSAAEALQHPYFAK